MEIKKSYITESDMIKWKEQYRKMRVDWSVILNEVKNNPIDTSQLTSSFDLTTETSHLYN